MPVPLSAAGAFLPYPATSVVSAATGPLAGLKLAVKDLFDVAGYPTGCGNPHLLAASGQKTETSTAVAKLLAAGASFAGKTQTDELAWSLFGMNPHFGTPLNFAAPDRIPGGSSSGSASAVASGLADIGLGTDTGGSIRAPASFCGLWGIRPTHGRIPLGGCMALAPSFDTAGFLARDGAIMIRVGSVLFGEDAAPLPPSPRLLRAADMFERLGDAPSLALATAAAGIGPSADVRLYAGISAHDLGETFRVLQSREIIERFGPWIAAEKPHLGAVLGKRFADAATISSKETQAAQGRRTAFAESIEALLGADGVILAPAVHDAPFRWDASQHVLDAYRPAAIALLCVAGLAGLPQVVVPAGRVGGAPIGLSLIGPRGSDASLLALACRFWPDGEGSV